MSENDLQDYECPRCGLSGRIRKKYGPPTCGDCDIEMNPVEASKTMSDIETIRVIRSTLKTVGRGVEGDPVHRHIQYWSMDGDLLWEECDGGYCD